tara:strand:- start:874 stop:1164 length:291 start_codon:yes stop_codon:yes gene_type:complete
MSEKIEQISGWKWTSKADAEAEEARLLKIIKLPIDGVTQKIFHAMPSYKETKEVDFYYAGYSYPSKLKELMPENPASFNIRLFDKKDLTEAPPKKK